MSDLSYSFIRLIGSHVVWVTSRPIMLHRERIPRSGPFILASNHLSPYDAAGLIYATPRHLDFLSIVQFLKNPLAGRFLKAMNCMFVDPAKTDQAAARVLARRLRDGRAVAIFPEAGIRSGQDSVINGGSFRPGCIRLAQLARVPIIPAVIVGTGVYGPLKSWLPLRAIRWGVIFGQPIEVPAGERAQSDAELKLRDAFLSLHLELRESMNARARESGKNVE
jgi:1-acyl-sn-glycerol-3-phosphate acyltransferase